MGPVPAGDAIPRIPKRRDRNDRNARGALAIAVLIVISVPLIWTGLHFYLSLYNAEGTLDRPDKTINPSSENTAQVVAAVLQYNSFTALFRKTEVQ